LHSLPIGRVVIASGVFNERLDPVGCVVGAGGIRDKRIVALNGVPVRQAGILADGSCLRREREAGERKRNKK